MRKERRERRQRRSRPPQRTPRPSPWRQLSLKRTAVLTLYGGIAMTTIVEAATRQPVFASLTTDAIARARGAHEHPDPPHWAGAANILVMPDLPSGTLAFTGGNTIVLSRQALKDESVLKHELVHTRQYARLTTFGATIAYAAHALKLLALTRGDAAEAYMLHPFELEAYEEQFGPQWPAIVHATRSP